MFTEILRIKPKLDQSDLRNMERSLTRRFARVAKSFGRGLRNVLKGGGVLGAIGVVVNALLNPLRQVNETLDRILGVSDNLSTFANQLGTTSGALAKLQTLAGSAGVSQDRLIKTLSRFQSEIGIARADPTLASPVREFTGIEDTAEAFFQFIQSLQRVDKDRRAAIASRVIGERGVIELTEFMSLDFQKQFNRLGLQEIPVEGLTQRVERIAEFQNLDDLLKSQRELREIIDASNKITEQTIRERNRAAEREQERNLERLGRIESIAALQRTMDDGLEIVEKGMSGITSIVGDLIQQARPFLSRMAQQLDRIVQFIDSFGKGTISKFFGGGRGE